jgi:hypothetical protein
MKMNPADNVERAIAGLHITTSAQTDRRILEDASVALRAGLQKRPIQPGLDAGRLRTIIRIAAPLAAAAVILLALSLLVNALFLGTATFADIQKAFAKAQNVCIATCRGGATEPFEQVWASQTLKVKLVSAGSGGQAQFTLWDVSNKVQMMKFLSSESVPTEPITEQMLAELGRSVIPFTSVFPSFHVSDAPDDFHWNQVRDPQTAAVAPEAEVYDLIWTAGSSPSGAVVHKRWRLFADNRTGLPRRAEWYAKSTPQDQYKLEMFAVISYPTESEIRDVVDSVFGSRWRGSGQPEPIGTPGMER